MALKEKMNLEQTFIFPAIRTIGKHHNTFLMN